MAHTTSSTVTSERIHMQCIHPAETISKCANTTGHYVALCFGGKHAVRVPTGPKAHKAPWTQQGDECSRGRCAPPNRKKGDHELMQSCYEVPAMLKAVLIMHQLAVGSSHKYAQTANHTTAVYNKLCSKATGGQFSTSSHLSHQPRAAPPPHFSKLKWPPPERRKSPKAPKAIHKNSCKARHQNDDHLR